MDEELRTAFRATRYCIDTRAGPMVLTVDQYSPALAQLLGVQGAGSMALLTAFNPAGQLQDMQRNIASQQALQQELEAAGYQTVPGHNEDPAGHWPDEPSLLVFGISLESARELASRHRQAAFLWCEAASATPRLIETAAPAGH